MDLIVRNKILYFENQKFPCSIGKNGLSSNKIEGDGCTPVGVFNFTEVFYRSDKIKKLDFKLNNSEIKENYGWCDDPESVNYNKLIHFPFSYSAERLHRSDNIYDLIFVINYNLKPIIPNKGSAIFMHLARDEKSDTQGCIALHKQDLIYLAERINKKTKIIIEA